MTTNADNDALVTLALCGDVMTGRGVDQILEHPGDPRLHEGYVKSALDYVSLAERANGPIPRRVAPSYIWGDALEDIRNARPDAFIINLETAITRSETFEPKGINYRMNPANIACIAATGVDCCVVANNHILDWGASGLEETLRTLSHAEIAAAGAGATQTQAQTPVALDLNGAGRLLVYACGSPSAGVSADWAAGPDKPGVNFLPNLAFKQIEKIARNIERVKEPGDIAVASIHWGANWGYEIPDAQRRFAHGLIDNAQVDIVHGHSSHHPKAAEIHNGRLILYGCGDFLNDYEGIAGREDYRPDLVLLYLVTLNAETGKAAEFELAPFRIEKFRLNHPSENDLAWLAQRLRREYISFGLQLPQSERGRFIAKPA